MTATTIPLPVVPATPILSEKQRNEIAEELSRLGVGEVRFDSHSRLLYSTDASLYQVQPIGVILPRDTGAVVTIVQYCAATKLPVLPRGGGSSLAGQCTNRAVVIDLSVCCRRLLDIDVAQRRCRVEPGIPVDELNRELAARGTGLFFAPDPASLAQATVGGCIGNNAAGARSIQYGRTSENVSGIEVVLSNGERLWLGAGAGRHSATALRLAEQVADVVRDNADEIRSRFPNLVRRNAGYALDLILKQVDRGVADADLDLSGLICGSEGTLAVVVGAELKLRKIPVARGLAVVSFADLESAIAAVRLVLPSGPSAVELLDEEVIRAALANTECQPFVEMLPKFTGRRAAAVLYVEYEAHDSPDQLKAFFDTLRQTLPDNPVSTYIDVAEMARAWTLRKASEALLHGLPGKAKPITFVEDNSVPVEQLSRFVSEFQKLVARHGTQAAYYAHASVGVLHIRPMLNLHETTDRQKMLSIAVEASELARQCGGVMSGEHGDGRARGPLLESFYGPKVTAAFKQIKTIFDPAGLFNPGNIVDPLPVSSIVENLRVDAESEAVDISKIDTYYQYSGEEGFAGALELCNGAGFCRKTAGGTMCPSYRATLDERHSTRGRANALRVAVTGQTDGTRHATAPDWEDSGVLGTLDLCLSCKACKTECPSNVDVAQLKSEYYAQRYRLLGASLQARAFGNVRPLNRMGSLMPRLSNFLIRSWPVRSVLGKMLGLAPQRALPPFAPSLYKWFRSRSAPARVGKPRVAIWADCFVTYNEPHIGQAAASVLEALGYAVELPVAGCCGRPLISTGQLEQAIRVADKSLRAMHRTIHDPGVVAIIVLEPSCLSAMKDEWLKLKLSTDLATRQRLAAKAVSIEEFVEQRWEQHPAKPERADAAAFGNQQLVLHGHCHQKALWGTGATVAALRRTCGNRVTVLDSGCCGMAGSFGYTADRYELSMKIGELSVFPPIRAAGENAVIVAPGTSCRHQIRDGTGRESLHPAEAMARGLCVSQ